MNFTVDLIIAVSMLSLFRRFWTGLRRYALDFYQTYVRFMRIP